VERVKGIESGCCCGDFLCRPRVIPKVKRVADETDTPIRYLIAVGAGHSLQLKE